MKQPTKHSNLNPKQTRILKLLFKFRYITPSLLLQYKQASSLSSLREALKILEDQQYIAKRYLKSYKLQGKGARYYLATKAIKLMRDEHGMDETVLHAMYKNKTVGEAFVDHHLDIFAAFMRLSTSYPKMFSIYTKYELGGLDYFPMPAPDLYLSRTDPIKGIGNDFFLDIFTDTQFFVIKKRFDQYVEHYESGDWEAENKTDYPVILIACPDSRLEEKLQTRIEKVFDSSGIDDLHIYTTTTKALLASTYNNHTIWTKASNPEKTVELTKL
jgi:hypothetical protein